MTSKQGTIDKKIKLTDAQRQALRKLYKAHVSGEKVDSKWATDPTKLALYKHGVIDGVLDNNSWRGNACIRWNSEKINALGIELGEKLFGMEWWEELIGAWISDCAGKNRQAERIANAKAIATTLNLNTEFVLSGNAEGYKARYENDLITITVEKEFKRFDETNSPYGIAIRWAGFGRHFNADEARRIAELSQEAARIFDVFTKAATS